jgi:hypothetical protein
MTVLPVLREGLDPLTCSVLLPLRCTLPFLHGTHNPSFFAGRLNSLHRPSSLLLFPGPITNEQK